MSDSVQWTIQSAADWVMWDHSKNLPIPKLPKEPLPGLIDFVRENRTAVIEQSLNRYFRCPPDGMVIPQRTCPNGKRERMRIFLETQSYLSDVRRWIDGRFILHSDMPAQDRMPQVAVDLIMWQFSHKPDPIQFVIDLE